MPIIESDPWLTSKDDEIIFAAKGEAASARPIRAASRIDPAHLPELRSRTPEVAPYRP